MAKKSSNDSSDKNIKSPEASNQIHLHSLKPVSDPRYNLYCEILKQAIDDPDNQNICLSGIFSSGKSSIIRTFTELNSENYEFLNISLACFNKLKTNVQEENAVKTDEIETKILQNLIFSADDVELESAKIYRAKGVSKSKVYKIIIAIYILLITMLLIVFYKDIDFNFGAFLNFKNIFIYLFGILSFKIITKSLIKIIPKILNIQIGKIKIGSNELEFSESDNSVFSKNIQVIVNFFEQTKKNVIIFEDLDRFENLEVLSKLREINIYVNNKINISKNRKKEKVVFIYSLNDDLFSGVDKAKFFDIIIPVMPFINNTNSCDLFIKLFNDSNETLINENEKDMPGLSTIFINDVAMYITDPRLLKNIFNEYLVYKNNLIKSNSNFKLYNELLALIVYKNKYSEDFNLLHSGKGILSEIFDHKTTLCETKRIEIEKDILELDKKIEYIKNDRNNSIESLNEEYVLYFYKNNRNLAYFNINSLNGQYDFSNGITSQKIFDLLYNNGFRIYSSSMGNSHPFRIQDIEDEVNEKYSYLQRKKIITQGKDILEKDCNDKNRELSLIKEKLINKKISELIDSDNFDKIISKSSYSHKVNYDYKLLKYLIINGYLNENYNYLLSLFIEGNLSPKDFDFIMSVKNKNNLGFNYALNDPKTVSKYLYAHEYEQVEVLNYDLVNFIFAADEESDSKKRALLSQFENADSNLKQFLFSYINLERYNIEAIEYFGKNLNLFCEFILAEKSILEINKFKILLIIVDKLTTVQISVQNKNDILTKYLNMHHDIIEFVGDDLIVKFNELLNLLRIKFVTVNIKNAKPEILRCIFENNLYSINKNNIISLLLFYDKFNDDLFNSRNFTYLMNTNLDFMKNYIKENIDIYIFKLYNELELEQDEQVDLLPFLINTIEKQEARNILINKNISLLKDIETITRPSDQIYIMNQQKIEVTKENLKALASIMADGIDIVEDFICYINKNSKLFATEIENITHEEKDDFNYLLRMLFEAKNLNLEIFDVLCKKFNFGENLNIDLFNFDKISILINNNRIKLDKYSIIKEKFPPLDILLLEKQKEEFLKNTTVVVIDSGDLIQLLNSNKFSIEEKAKIIETVNLDILDDSTVSKSIIELYLNNDNLEISFDKIKFVLEKNSNLNKKIKILNKYFSINLYSDSEIIELIKSIKDPNLIKIIEKKGGKINFEYNEDIKELIDFLELNNFISSYNILDNKIQVNCKRK